jgi:acyl-CoA synthetase (AMP-forming)/AMP-acid ligase II
LLPFPGTHGGRVNPVRGMAGILAPSLEARIVREDGSDADYEEIGELVLRGPTVALGYWNNEKATKRTFRDGWLYTGDRFYVDKQMRFLYASYFHLSSSYTEKGRLSKLCGPGEGMERAMLAKLPLPFLPSGYLQILREAGFAH